MITNQSSCSTRFFSREGYWNLLLNEILLLFMLFLADLICITAVLEVWLWHELPLCLLTCHSGIFQPASRVWKTDFLFDIIIYHSFTLPGSSHPCLHHWNGWPSDSDLPEIGLACMTSAPQYQCADASKVSWVCRTCMITIPQSLCATAGKSTYVT